MRTVVGLFETGREARRAIDELSQLGFSPKNISVVTNLSSKSAIEKDFIDSDLHTMSLSDVGTVATSGPLTSNLEGLGSDTGLAQLLQRSGLSSDLAEHFASGVERGETLESLTCGDADAERVAAVMKKYAAGSLRQEIKKEEPKKLEAIPKMAAAGAAAGAIGQAVSSRLEPEKIGTKHGEGGHIFVEEEKRIPIYREELKVGKREVERGGVRVTTHIVEKPYSEQILLREEQVEIERRPADRVVRADEVMLKEQRIDMSEMAEEAVGAKQMRLVEEVVVHKHVKERTATVGDTLRATQIDVVPFDANAYKAYFDSQKFSGVKFEDYVPAYRFGENFPRASASSNWEDVQNDAKAKWEEKNPGTWDKFKDSIRYAWSKSGKK